MASSFPLASAMPNSFMQYGLLRYSTVRKQGILTAFDAEGYHSLNQFSLSFGMLVVCCQIDSPARRISSARIASTRSSFSVLFEKTKWKNSSSAATRCLSTGRPWLSVGATPPPSIGAEEGGPGRMGRGRDPASWSPPSSHRPPCALYAPLRTPPTLSLHVLLLFLYGCLSVCVVASVSASLPLCLSVSRCLAVCRVVCRSTVLAV